MSYYEDEHYEIYCYNCGAWISKAIECPESGEEIKRNAWIWHTFCQECCKEFINNRDCEGSCEEDFVEENRISRLKEICESHNLHEYDVNTYQTSDKGILISLNEFEEKFEKNPIAIDTPFLMHGFVFVRNEDELHVFDRENYEFLHNLLENEFNEYPRYFLQSEKLTDFGIKRILKLEGDHVSGLLFPIIDTSFDSELDFKLKMKKEFMEYMEEGIDVFNVTKEIEKYCLITQDYCKFNINYQGKDSYFAAYPFNPSKWPRFITRLKHKLQEKDLQVILPIDEDESFPETGILFCKLCKMIHSTNSIICEITQINQNVMFEAGYGLGLGKFSYFLIDNSYDPKKHISNDLIRDLQQIYYLDANQCSMRFNSREEDISHLLPKRKPKITGGCCNKKIKCEKNSILLLIPDDSYHKEVIEPKLQSLLKDFKINENTKLAGHTLCNYCEAIQKSEIIIGDLVSDDSAEKDSKNSEVSFLLGFSLAMEKKIIILQQEPIHHQIIDFNKISRKYVDEEEIEEIVKEYVKLNKNDKDIA